MRNFFFGGGGVLESIFFLLFFFVTSSVIVDVVNTTGLHCVRVYAVATFMVNRGGELLEIRTQFTPACPFKLRVCCAFMPILITMGIGTN